MLPNINVLGSVPYTNTPAFGISPAQIDPASSVGPGRVLFDLQGNPITPVTEGVPQFEAPDGTLTGTAGTNFATDPFFGTSAAAPSAGAVGALLLQADRALTTAQVTSVLAQSVIPVTALAPSSGAGLIQARAAVEIAAAYAGDRWAAARNGNWSDGSAWTNAAPTNTQAASLDDNLGGFTGFYVVTVDTAGDTAGSLVLASPAGSTVELDINTGGVLAIGGGSAASDITEGDALVSNNGTLRLAGGMLTVSGSLNVNNGTATLLSGTAMANNYAQTAGVLTVGGASSSAALNLTGTGFTEIGGTASVGSAGALITTSLSVSAAAFSVTATNATVTDSGVASFTNNAVFDDKGSVTATALWLDTSTALVEAGGTVRVGTLALGSSTTTSVLTVAGTLIDTGDVAAGVGGSTGSIILQAGAQLSIGGMSAFDTIAFTGAAALIFTSTDIQTTNLNLNDIISGFTNPGDVIDFSGLTYNAADTLAYSVAAGAQVGNLTVYNELGNGIAQISYASGSNYTVNSFALTHTSTGHVEITAACYCPGTLIRTEQGDVPIERLRIGDTVTTVSGAHAPIRWIGRRSYGSRFIADNRNVLPVRIRAGALGRNVPRRDLHVSPLHAMFIDGLLVPAASLVNGASITQEEHASKVEYIHLELARHDVIIAEGASSESFVDDDSRIMFHNVHEYAQLYPDAAPVPAEYCAPRVTQGYALQAIRARIDARAGLRRGQHAPLRGFVDALRTDLVEGWAQNTLHPEAPVCLDVLVEGTVVAQSLANRFRRDLATAQLGSGYHSFSAALPAGLTALQRQSVEVRRSMDGAALNRSTSFQMCAA